MGRWAQASRRGGGVKPAVALGPPPAPSLNQEEYVLTQNAEGVDNPGGTLTLYRSLDEGENWDVVTTAAWLREKVWGDYEGNPGWYRGTETGNGLVYSGESLPSGIMEL